MKMNMIIIQWEGDRGSHSQDDTDRARRAAEAVLDAAGITDYSALFAEACAAVDECREVPAVWRDAEYAAWQAGTQGWAKPYDVDISISA